jgi:hypothetical protein
LATFVAVSALVFTATAAGAQASPTGPDRIGRPDRPVPEQYIVTLRETPGVGLGDADVLTRLHGGRLLQRFQTALRGFTVQMTEAQAQALARDPRVAAIEQDGYVTADATQTPTPSWGLDRVDQRALPLSNSYLYNTTGAGVRAYIIDSGIRTSAADFGGRAIVGRDTINDGQNGQDCNGHGTHVAGTVGGNLYGIAKNVQLVAVRVLNCSGTGTWSQVIAGIDWVTQNAVKPAVANMSLSGGVSSAVNNAVANSINSGVTYAVAAGNNNANACSYSPSSAANALTVGATTSTDARASYSNFGTCVDLFAPGSAITSVGANDATPGVLSGTSMASPHVAGTAALYLEANPGATPATVASALKTNATANVVGSPGTGSPNLLLFEGFIGGTPEPPPATPPGQPVLTATGGNTTVSLSWTAPSPGSQPIMGYRIFRGSTSGAEALLIAPPGTGTSYVDTGLVNGQTYWYQVSAVSSVGEGARSVGRSATPQAATPPGAPTLTAAQPWFFNIGRQRALDLPKPELQAFSPTKGGWHVPGKFGRLEVP